MNNAKSFSVLTLTCQKTDYFDNSRPICFYFEDYYLYKGKMKAYSLIILICCTCIYTTVDIMTEFKRNILNFGYGINFKYKGMFSHSFDRFYVVTKCIQPAIEDIKSSPITLDMECSYLHIKLDKNAHVVKHFPNIRSFCSKIIPLIHYYRKHVHSYNKIVYNILMKKIP